MSALNTVTLDEKIHLVGRLIAAERNAGRSTTVLTAIHADLSARTAHAPSVAMVELDRKITVAKRSKIPGMGYGNTQMIALAKEVVCRWAVIRQSLEMFGAEIEQELTS